jgi:hypothetical protein
MASGTTPLTPVSELWVSATEVTSTQYDWYPEPDSGAVGWPEAWDVVRAVKCPSCRKFVAEEDEEVENPEWQQLKDQAPDEEPDVEEFVEVEAGACANPECDRFTEEADPSDTEVAPMMNYYYKLPNHHTFGPSDARKLEGLPLCIVTFGRGQGALEDEQALALTGGGMDLSWEICEAFMRLGFLPPAAFARVPAMAGKPRGPVDLWVLEGVERTGEVIRTQGERLIAFPDEMLTSAPRYRVIGDSDARAKESTLYGVGHGAYDKPEWTVPPTLTQDEARAKAIELNREYAEQDQ